MSDQDTTTTVETPLDSARADYRHSRARLAGSGDPVLMAVARGLPADSCDFVLVRPPDRGVPPTPSPTPTRSTRGTGSARRPRGVGRVYQPTYRDKKTGELRRVETW